MKNRLDIHKQIKGYYSIFFSEKFELRPAHTSLYMFLLNQNNRSLWVEWFKCPYDLGMQGSGIHSKNTYYKTLADLQTFGLIEYQKGINDYKAPKIKIIDLSSVSNLIPLSEPLSEPLSRKLTIPLSEPLSDNIIRLITNNFKLISDNIEKIIFDYKEKKENSEKSYLLAYIYDGIPADMIKTLSVKDRHDYSNLVWDEFFINSQSWVDSTCMMRQVTESNLKNDLKYFLKNEIQKDTIFKGYAELKKHFINYLNKKQRT